MKTEARVGLTGSEWSTTAGWAAGLGGLETAVGCGSGQAESSKDSVAAVSKATGGVLRT